MSDHERDDNPNPSPEQNTQPKELNQPRRFLPTRIVCIYVLGGLSGFCWVIGPTLLNSHSQPIYAAWGIMCIGFWSACIAGRLWIINHRTKHPMPGWLDSNWTLFCVMVGCLFVCSLSALWFKREPSILFVASPTIKDKESKTTPSATASDAAQKTDFVEGTEISRSMLERIFPFGYRVIFSKDGALHRDHGNTGKIEWDIDWGNTTIIPDFSSERVNWSVAFSDNPSNSTSPLKNLTVTIETGMVAGLAYELVPIPISNQPKPFGMTIGFNQLSPVFVIGFAIRSR